LVVGSNGSHFVWPPIPTWFNHGRRAYTHESTRAVTSATTSSIVPIPQLSLLCWIRPGLADLFSQLEGGDSSKSCTPSEGKVSECLAGEIENMPTVSDIPFVSSDHRIRLECKTEPSSDFRRKCRNLKQFCEGNRSL